MDAVFYNWKNYIHKMAKKIRAQNSANVPKKPKIARQRRKEARIIDVVDPLPAAIIVSEPNLLPVVMYSFACSELKVREVLTDLDLLQNVKSIGSKGATETIVEFIGPLDVQHVDILNEKCREKFI